MLVPVLIHYRNTLWTRCVARTEKSCWFCRKKIKPKAESFRPMAENGHGVVRNQRLCSDCVEAIGNPPHLVKNPTVNDMIIRHMGEPKVATKKTKKPLPDLRGKLISGAEAAPSSVQHTTPCSDCPWRRDALPGWLGSLDVDEWLKSAHGETRMECHTVKGPQCAGAAIYRANMLKSPRDKSLLRLTPDRETVFANPNEFRKHHEDGEVTFTVPIPKGSTLGKEVLKKMEATGPSCGRCHAPVDEEYLCAGCGEYICSKCDLNTPWGSHSFTDHFEDDPFADEE
jgi:hypothetical protein